MKTKTKTIYNKRVAFSRGLAIMLTLGLGACNDLDEYNPSNATAETVWSTPEGFVTVVNGAYSEQRSWYGKEDGEFMSESGTDLWFNSAKSTYAGQLTQYAGLTPLQGNPNRAAWTLLWKSINLCNAGINRINGAGFTSAQDKNQREGELRFLRAFYYWHVVETWGGVMLRTQETQEPVLTATRSSVNDFYDLIISDLEFAVANLPVSWGNEYSRATNKAAMGFLARAYLSRAYYSTGSDAQTYFTKARDMANSVINRRAELKVDLWSSYVDLFNPVNNKKQGRDGGEALYVISNSTNQSINYDDQGNRLFQVFQTPYNGKPGLEQSVVYGYENNRRLMPTLTLLDLYDATKDSRYEGSFQEVWLANKAYTWTAADVKWELLHAFRVLFDMPGGGGGSSGFWPTMYPDPEDLEDIAARERFEMRRVKAHHSPRDIKRMEAILLGDDRGPAWLPRFLKDYPAARRCLAKWAIWRASDRIVKDECRLRGLAYSTFRKKRDQAAEIIAAALNEARVELR